MPTTKDVDAALANLITATATTAKMVDPRSMTPSNMRDLAETAERFGNAIETLVKMRGAFPSDE